MEIGNAPNHTMNSVSGLHRYRNLEHRQNRLQWRRDGQTNRDRPFKTCQDRRSKTFSVDCTKYRKTGNGPNGDQKPLQNKGNLSSLYGRSNSTTTRKIALRMRSYYSKGPHVQLSSCQKNPKDTSRGGDI